MYTLIVLAILLTGGKVSTTITDIATMAECRAIAEHLTGEIERRGGAVQKSECK